METATTGFDRFDGLLRDTVEIPLLGVVAAGEPYRAFVLDDTLSVPAALWGGRKVFAVRVRGSSMIDEGIHDGDFLIVQPCETAENGQTVVAEVDGCVTVKRLFREPDLLPLVVRGDNICIRGVVVGVMRKYGFATQEPKPPRADASRKPAAPCPAAAVDDLFEASLNAIDQQLARWQMNVEQAKHDRRRRRQVPQMAELGRDLQALREWLGRTGKAGLRRALIAEANKIIRRMQRFAVLQPAGATETLLH